MRHGTHQAYRRIQERRAEIINTWASEVRSQIAAAQYQDEVILCDGLEPYLDAVVAFMASSPGTQAGERSASEVIYLCRQHGQQRALATQYSLDQVIFEYRLLREVLLDVLEEPVSAKLVEINKVLEAIDYGISEAATAFAQVRGFDKHELYKEAKKDAVEQKVRADEVRAEAGAVRNERDEFQSVVTELKREREIREQFVAALSHDLKNPLFSAKFSAELILRTACGSEKHITLASDIVNILVRTDRMITDLLDANHIRAGERLPLKLEEFDLRGLVHETVTEFASTHSKAAFTVSCDTELRGFWSHDGLKRVIENLVINAIKYGDPRKVIHISAWKKDHRVHLSVHNEGNPISPEDQSAVFTPFLRSRSAVSSGKKGWGLGLTLVRGILDAHGGSVVVNSSAESGTTFQVSLPLDSRPFQAVKGNGTDQAAA